MPGLSTENVLYLNFDMEKEQALPMTTMIATSLKAIWESARDQRPPAAGSAARQGTHALEDTVIQARRDTRSKGPVCLVKFLPLEKLLVWQGD